ncbi:MAG TPA: hypothetical protein ENI87_02580 [bacterium]|nr:hypothetical protein [bacterium]
MPAAWWRDALPGFVARIDRLLASLPAAAPGGELLLLGRANAGKSSLANALAGRDEVLVADVAGTTRDLLRVDLGGGVHLWDAPGDLDAPADADAAALALRDRLAGRASALVVVIDAADPVVPASALASPQPWFAVVFTKVDLVAEPPPLAAAVRGRLPAPDRCFPTSAHTGAGLADLRAALRRCGHNGVDPGGPLRAALQGAGEALRRAVDAASLAPELCAVDLHAALRCLDGIGGTHDPEQLLDRIYGRFCLGK